ncbi:MAG: baseplate J/gp47 family protein [Candidatus Limnocylindrales bacterium]
MSVCYLEVDDEITGAISKLRAVRDGEAVIVVPPGSRIATSRINFKLLTREGNERRLNLVAVSDDPSVRALAISAGLPAYDSIAAAEQGLANFREQDRRLAERLGGQTAGVAKEGPAPARKKPDALDGTQVLAIPPVPSAGRGPSLKTARDPTTAGKRPGFTGAEIGGTADRRSVANDDRVARGGRRVGNAPLIGAAALVLLVVGVGYGAYVLLPTATITLQPVATQLSPAPFTVVADPNVAVTDVAAGVVPAQLIEIPLSVGATFPATGIEARETRATGTVRFRSENTLNEVAVLEGTGVSTRDGIDFETTAPAVVPRADFATSTPGAIDVPVRATRLGPRGNVAAETISELPAGLRGQLVSVRNPDPTDGGRRVEESVVTQADFDAAMSALDGQLHVALADAMALPGTTPRGLTLYPGTAQTGSPEPSPTATEIVGKVQSRFMVRYESVATVLAVNEVLVDELAASRVRSMLSSDQQIVGDQVVTSHSATSVIGETIPYEVTATATVFSEPDTAALATAVRGKSIPEARQILVAYGVVEIFVWPEFVDRLPDQTARISLVVVNPSPRP